MKPYVNQWLKALVAATVTGLANSVLGFLGVAGAQAAGVNVQTLDLKQLGVMALTGGLVGAMAYLKQSPVPMRVPRGDGRWEMGDRGPRRPGPQIPLSVVALAGCLVLGVGCANPYQKSIQTSSVVAEGALAGWRVYEEQTHPPIEESLKVITVADQYYLAEDLALVSYAQWHAVKSGDKKQVEAAVDGLAEAAGTLVELVESFMGD